MKKYPGFRIALVVAVTTVCFIPRSTSAEPQASSSRVQVLFDHPERFLDIRDKYFATEEGKKEVLTTLQEYIVQRAPSFLPEGDSLRVTFDNIKLAGVFNVGGVGERRVVLASTPPMFMFEWTVTDRSGKIIGSAKEKLEENNFKDLSSKADQGDPYRYEKAVLDDWMRNRLQG